MKKFAEYKCLEGQPENKVYNQRIERIKPFLERAVKPFLMGQNNWLFADMNKGTEPSMMWCSVIESTKLNNLNVYGYLLHLLTELPKLGIEPSDEQIDRLVP